MDKPLGVKSPPVETRPDAIRINWYSPIYNMHMYWTKQKPEVVASFIEKYCPKGGTVLDAFGGSGMTGVGALLAGRNAIVSDLSPFCSFLAENFTKSCDLKMLKKQFGEITSELDLELEWLFRTSCHRCEALAKIHAVLWADDFICPSCDTRQNLCKNGEHLRLKKGSTLDVLKCGHCQQAYPKTMKQFVGSSPIAIEVECGACGHEGKRNSREPDSQDLLWLQRVAEFKISGFVPWDTQFPDGINTRRCQQRGIKHPYQLFSKMNLIYLSGYWSKVLDLTLQKKISETLRDKLLFIATSTMFHASLMRRWLPYRTGVPLKGTLFVPSLTEDIRFSRVLRYQAKRVFRGQEAVNRISLKSGKSVKRGVKCRVSSALDLGWIKNDSVDYLYYDPPFGGHINYSELNLVWEAWLLKLTDTSDEAIVNHVQKKTLHSYQDLLGRALEEGSRKLKVGGHFTIVLAHSDLSVWRILQTAVAPLPLEIQGAPVILDSANKTFIQVYSDRAQQNMIAFTFKKNKGSDKKNLNLGRSLKKDFIPALMREVDQLLSARPLGARRDEIFDHLVRTLFSESVFEKMDLDRYLAAHYARRAGRWYMPYEN